MNYGNLPIKETDDRQTVCYRNGGIRCGCGGDGRPAWETKGWCNITAIRYPYDDSWEKEKKRMEELLKDE